MSTIFLPHIFNQIFNKPLLIEESKLSGIIWALKDRIGIRVDDVPTESLILKPSLPVRRRRANFVVEDGIGIVPVHGTLVHRTMGISALSGLTSYADIEANFEKALDNKDVHTILLDVDSLGGEVAGVFDLADVIYNSRNKKQIIAVANEIALSAGYLIASSANKVFMSRTAKAGSIGVIALHVDRSAKNIQTGIKYTAVYAGAKKNDFNPNEPLADSAKADLQIKINNLYDLFTKTVARNNGLTQEEIKNQEAAIYLGEAAINAGLVDKILPFNEVFRYAQTGKGKIMSKRNASQPENTKSPEQDTMEGQESQAIDQEHPESQEKITRDLKGKQKEKPITNEMKQTLYAEERTRITEITNLCSTMEVSELASHFIQEGYSLTEAKQAIQTSLAKQSEVNNIVSKHAPKQKMVNPLIEDAKRRAELQGQDSPLV